MSDQDLKTLNLSFLFYCFTVLGDLGFLGVPPPGPYLITHTVLVQLGCTAHFFYHSSVLHRETPPCAASAACSLATSAALQLLASRRRCCVRGRNLSKAAISALSEWVLNTCSARKVEIGAKS